MGYAVNVALSIPTAFILYILTEKMIINLTSESKFTDRVQKSFVIGFVSGLVFIVLGMTMFNEESNMNNLSIRFALYISGVFLALNSILFSWDELDESAKIIILGFAAAGLILYSYQQQNSQKKILF
jgi:hypothetical protein